MSGLSDEERSTLERWARGEYGVTKRWEPDGDDENVARSLLARGLVYGDVHYDGRFEERKVVTFRLTMLGAIALRADAAARAAGIWP